MTDYLVKTYDGVSLGSAVASMETSSAVRERSAAPVGRGGRYDAGSLHDVYVVTLTGIVRGTDRAGLRTAWDAFCGLFRPGTPKKLMVDSDRYLMASRSSDIRTEPTKGLPWLKYSLTLKSSDDPPWWAETASTQALASGATTFTVGGTGSADAIITVVVSSAPGGALVTITDAAGVVCTLAPDATGTFIIDSTLERITKSGVDKTKLLGSSEFLRLSPGSNTLTVALSGSATLTSIGVTWRNRWY